MWDAFLSYLLIDYRFSFVSFRLAINMRGYRLIVLKAIMFTIVQLTAFVQRIVVHFSST